jgi:hypothetical protein
MMQTLDDKIALTRHCLALCDRLSGASRPTRRHRLAEVER